MVRSPLLRKRIASALLLTTVAVQLHASGAWTVLQNTPVFAPFLSVQSADAQSTGNFYQEGAMPKYGKTWLATITCRNPVANQNVTFGNGDAHQLAALVRQYITNKGLGLNLPQQAIVRSDGGTGSGFNWNDNSGTIHTQTVTAVCQILGDTNWTYVSSTCRDTERSGIYPNGKCNFHSPEDNQMARFTGTIFVPACSNGRDDDGDGRVDMNDPGCSSPSDNNEGDEAACQDGRDNDGDGKIDFPADPGCTSPTDNDETDPANNNAQCVGITGAPSSVTAGQTFQATITLRNTGNTTWTRPNYMLSSENPMDNSNWGPGTGRTELNPSTVAPNQNASFTRTFTAPSTPGTYNFDFGMVLTTSHHFGEVCRQSITVTPVQCPATRVTAAFEGKQGPWEDTSPNGDAKPPTFVSGVQAGGTVKVISATGTYSARIHHGNDELPLTCDKGTLSFTNNANQTISKVRLDTAFNGVTVPNGATRAYVSHDEPGSFNYFDNSGNRDKRAPCQVTFDVTPNSCQLAQCRDGIDNDGDGLIDFPQDPGCVNQDDNDEGPRNLATLDVQKTITTSSITPGQNVFYTITVRNTGTVPANNVSVFDYFLDSQDLKHTPLTFVTSTGIPCTYQSAAQQVHCPIATIGAGQTMSMTLQFSAPNTLGCGQSIRNRADAWINGQQAGGDVDEITANVQCLEQCRDGRDNDGDGLIDFPQDPGCTSPTDNDEFNQFQCQDGIDNDGDGLVDFPQDPGCTSPTDNDEGPVNSATLNVTKTASSTQVQPGGTITYTIRVRNIGNVPARDVVVFDYFAAVNGQQFTELPFTFVSANGATCAFGRNNNAQAHMRCTFPTGQSDIAPGTEKTITVTYQAPAGQQQCNQTVRELAAAFVAGGPTPNQAFVGSVDTQIVCPVTPQCRDGIDNDGDGAIDFPADFSCSSPDDNDETNPKAQCQDGIDNDGDGLVDFPQDPGCTSKQDNDEFNAPQTVDLSITKTGPASVTRGQPILYTIQVRNLGSIQATNLVVTDPVPTGLTFNGALSHGTCQQSGNNVVCTHPQLNAGQSGTFTIAFNAPVIANCTQSVNVVNTVSVSSAQQDSNTSNNTATTVNNPTRVDCPVPLPQCRDGIDNDGDGLIDFPFDPGCTSPDDNDEYNAPQTVDLSITKTGPASVTRGQPIFYTIQIGNAGTAQATNVVITDPIPAGLVYNDALSYGPCQQSGNNVVCTQSTVNAGQFGSFIIAFDTPTIQNCSTVNVVNTATISSAQQDSNTSNNTATTVNNPTRVDCPVPTPQCRDGIDNDGDGLIDFPADPGCTSLDDNDETNPAQTVDLSIVKTGPASVVRGQPIFYTIQIGNAGTVQATNVVITDAIPAGLAYNDALSYGPCQQSGNNVICTQSTLNAGQFGSFTIAFDTPAIQNCQTTNVVNSATIASAQQDSNTANNSSSTQNAPTRIDCPTQLPQCRDGIDNDGDGATDFPADFSCSSPDDNDETNPKAQCQDGIDNDGDGLVDFPFDPGCTSPQDNDEFNQVQTVDLSITKTGPASVTRGQTVFYTVQVGNAGTAQAMNVVVTDQIPTGLVYNDALSYGPCQQSGNAVTCAIGAMSPSQFGFFTIAFDAPVVQNCTVVNVTNTATIQGQQTDANQANNSSTTSATRVDCPAVNQCNDGIDNDGDGRTDFPSDAGCTGPTDNNEGDGPTDLAISLSGPSSVQRGGTATYIATISNNGPDAATTPFSIQVTVPTGAVYNAAASSPNCAQQGAVVVCSGITLNVNQQTTRTVSFTIPGTLASSTTNLFNLVFGIGTANAQAAVCNTTITVTGTIQTAPQGDPNPANNQSTVSTFVSCPATPQCSDGIDNDGDGKIDMQDPGCSSPTDNNEADDPVQYGCIEIKKETFDPHGNALPIAAQFTFILDATRVSYNDAQGRARFDQVLAGQHTVAEIIPSGWSQLSVTPQNGTVTVVPGQNCAQVTFRNRQVFVANAQCSDGFDNDGDGLTDYPQDPGCSSPTDNDEFNNTFVPQCRDGIDNDGDGKVDFPADPGCQNLDDNNEQDQGTALPACSDGIDNDGDGLKDYPQDPGCSSAQDTDETNTVSGTFACNDGIDNDGDGLKDYPQDPGCSSPTDNDEFNFRAPRCSDGIDNDGDGLVDFPQDPGCTTAYDDNEWNNRYWLDRWREWWNWNW